MKNIPIIVRKSRKQYNDTATEEQAALPGGDAIRGLPPQTTAKGVAPFAIYNVRCLLSDVKVLVVPFYLIPPTAIFAQKKQEHIAPVFILKAYLAK